MEVKQEGDATPCGVVAKRQFRQRTMTELRSLARSFTKGAIDVLVHLMSSKEVAPAARVAAAIAILDRGWGKPVQPHDAEGSIELIHRIERVIVHPDNFSRQAAERIDDAALLNTSPATTEGNKSP
ncbi:hypothetical protein ABID59_001909 [Bradyrhizobium sp. S3.3.6]|uniref:hypothetical protein n=1 Tax=unclassified Bradyrhizobium TaxID=2631580 RepID=UPI003392DF3F